MPTPIQVKSIPSVLSGKDILGLAQTGTGKTAAFVLPILQRLITNRPEKKHPRVRVLILAPTRELAEQILGSVRQLSEGTDIKSISIYGGVGMHPQVRNLRSNPEIVVACPGRLLDHIRQRNIDLSSLETLVLDEADHMFDMGFLPDVKSIVRATPQERQTLMFSATMPSQIKTLALEILSSPVTIQADKGGVAKTVSHALYPVRQDLKTDLVLKLLEENQDGSVLIFARTKHRAKKLSEKLAKASHSATCLQGNLSQYKRQEAISGFRAGEYRIMVATDIAARGIDVSSVSHVINYDIPATVEAYTHRIGRTGRAAQTGSAITLVGGEDEFMVRSIERAMGEKIVRKQVKDFNYQAPRVAKDSSERDDNVRNEHRGRDRNGSNRDRHATRDNGGRRREERRGGGRNGNMRDDRNQRGNESRANTFSGRNSRKNSNHSPQESRQPDNKVDVREHRQSDIANNEGRFRRGGNADGRNSSSRGNQSRTGDTRSGSRNSRNENSRSGYSRGGQSRDGQTRGRSSQNGNGTRDSAVGERRERKPRRNASGFQGQNSYSNRVVGENRYSRQDKPQDRYGQF